MLLLALVLGVAVLGAVEAQGGWRKGRATFYGDQPWLWDIHKGSCGFGQLDPNKGTGWDITALPDAHYEYSHSCGRCYEVKCDPSVFGDNYGNSIDRSTVCYDPDLVVKVTVSDTCPCDYPSNYYSNKRWCCGDMDHLDLSYVTFDKLAERRWGVIGLLYRPVACSETAQTVEAPGGGAVAAEGSRLHWLRNFLTTGAMGQTHFVQSFEG